MIKLIKGRKNRSKFLYNAIKYMELNGNYSTIAISYILGITTMTVSRYRSKIYLDNLNK